MYTVKIGMINYINAIQDKGLTHPYPIIYMAFEAL